MGWPLCQDWIATCRIACSAKGILCKIAVEYRPSLPKLRQAIQRLYTPNTGRLACLSCAFCRCSSCWCDQSAMLCKGVISHPSPCVEALEKTPYSTVIVDLLVIYCLDILQGCRQALSTKSAQNPEQLTGLLTGPRSRSPPEWNHKQSRSSLT